MKADTGSNLAPRRILVRGVNWLGDAVMTTPALRRLRERFPRAHITLLTHEKLADLWLHHPEVDEVMTFRGGQGVLSVAMKLLKSSFLTGFRDGRRAFDERNEFPLGDAGGKVAEPLTEAAEQSRQNWFDLALVLPNSPRSALEVWLARIPRRVGYARPWRNWLLTLAVAPRPDRVEMRKRTPAEIRALLANQAASPSARPPLSVAGNPRSHQVYDYLHLVGALGASTDIAPPFLYVTHDELLAAARRFGVPEDSSVLPLIGLNAGAEYGPAKRWPLEHFAATVQEVQRSLPCHWLILGGPRDVPLATELESRLRSPASGLHPPALTNLAGQSSLRELMAVLKLCRVVLTNDTGPMHVAAALGTPVVVPFGSTSPELTGPGLPGDPQHHLLRSKSPCAPCFLRECPVDFRCMREIPPAAAARAALAALRRTDG